MEAAGVAGAGALDKVLADAGPQACPACGSRAMLTRMTEQDWKLVVKL